MKTILIANFHPFVTRNILDSGVLDLLAKDNKVIIAVPKHKEGYFKKIYESGSVVVESVDTEVVYNERKNIFFERIAELLLDTNVKKYHKMVLREKTGKNIKYYISILITKTFGHSTLFKRLFRFLDNLIVQTAVFDSIFDKHKPDVVFATDIFNNIEALLLRLAKRKGITDVGMVRSWDNTTTKTFLRTLPSKVIVQNEVMKEEMVRLHHVREKTILLSGITQYEVYLTHKPMDRDAFCRKLGLDPKKRIILVSPASDYFSDTDWQLCEILKRLYHEKKVPQNIQFLIRPHPYNDTDLSRFKSDENFVIDYPIAEYTSERHKEKELGQANLDHLADTLYHSALLINVISSIIIDAMAYDKPVITVGFDGWEKHVPFTRSLARWQTEECVIHFLSQGASPHVRNIDELSHWINTYLEKPGTHKAERKRLLDLHSWKFDGKAADRIATYVGEAML